MKNYLTYVKNGSAAFQRSRDPFGDLSNMTFGFPIVVNGISFQGSEGLYQALKFPEEPEHQLRIARERSGMYAKKTAYTNPRVRPDWEETKVDAMRYTLAEKLRQHPERFGRALAETAGMPIVEISRRDDYWGAKPSGDGNTLRGRNVLGRLLTELRDLLQDQHDIQAATLAYLKNTKLKPLIINGFSVTEVEPCSTSHGRDRSQDRTDRLTA